MLRADTPNLIWDVDRFLRGSIEGSGANVIRRVEGLPVFVMMGRDVVDWNCSLDDVNSESFESSGYDDDGILTVRGIVSDVGMPVVSMRKSVMAGPTSQR